MIPISVAITAAQEIEYETVPFSRGLVDYVRRGRLRRNAGKF
jgi:hypothetical protein